MRTDATAISHPTHPARPSRYSTRGASLRITAVTTWFPTEEAPSRGSFVVRDVHAIQQHHDVRLVHLVPPQDDDGTRIETVEGIETLRIPMNPSSPVSVASAARRLGSALRGSDLVHSMAFSSLLPFSVPGLRSVPSGAPWIHTEHWSALSTPQSLGRARLALPALSQLLRGPDVVTSVCEYLATPIRRVRGARPVAIVPCIVEPHALAPRRSRTDGELRLISTGGLIPRKDPLTAVRTIAELRKLGTNASLTWLGDGPLAEQTQDLASQLGVSARVQLLGSVSGDGVRRQLSEHDVFFGPTLADNFFVSAAEAIVAGRPVVVGATGGQGEYIADSVGTLVDHQDPAAYARVLIDLDERTRHLSSEQIAATIGDAFSSATVGAQYADVYSHSLGG